MEINSILIFSRGPYRHLPLNLNFSQIKYLPLGGRNHLQALSDYTLDSFQATERLELKQHQILLPLQHSLMVA